MKGLVAARRGSIANESSLYISPPVRPQLAISLDIEES
jgi:hypothetical protein